MARIETIKGYLNAIDDENKIVEIELEDNVIHVQTTFPDTRIPNIKRYRYAEKLEWETPSFLDCLGKQVEVRLVDGVVDKITSLT